MKHTKKALFMSALSMLLCLTMLIGSTFAWFTDTVTTGKNKIIAGNLDVELEYDTGRTDEDGNTIWEAVTADTNLFKSADETLWEPGHTEYVKLRIRNAGSLALKYTFSLNVFGSDEGGEENTYTSVEFDKENPTEHAAFKLSDYLVFNKIEDLDKVNEKDRTTFWDDSLKQGNFKDIAINGESEGEDAWLKPNDTKEFYLAVYMPTTVGNEANQLTGADDGKAPTVFLGITLRATQKDYESDSFGIDYDKDAEYSPIGSPERVEALVNAGYTEVKDVNSLVEALNSPDVDKIVVSEDISVSGPLTPAKDLTIDLNGNNFESSGRSLQVVPGKEIAVKNGTLSSNEIAAFCSGGDLTLDNVEIEGGENAAVFVGDSGNVNISGGSISAKGSANAVWANSGSNVVNIKGTVITSETHTVVAYDNSKINFDNCELSTTSATAFPVATNGSGSKGVVMSFKNSKINSSLYGWAAYFPSGTVELVDCTVSGAVVITGGDVTINGGTYTAEGSPDEAPYVWNEADTWEYCQGFKPGSGAGHMGDSILIVDRRTNGYELKSVAIKNATFNTRFTDENGDEQTAYAIKYVDLNNSDVAKITPVFENNTYNHKLANGSDPVMILDSEPVSLFAANFALSNSMTNDFNFISEVQPNVAPQIME